MKKISLLPVCAVAGLILTTALTASAANLSVNSNSATTGSGIDATAPKGSRSMDPSANRPSLNMSANDCSNLSSVKNELSSQEYGKRERYCIEQNLGNISRTPGADTSATARSDTRFGSDNEPNTLAEEPNRSITGKPHTGDPRSITDSVGGSVGVSVGR